MALFFPCCAFPSCQGVQIIYTRHRLKEVSELQRQVRIGQTVTWSEVEAALERADLDYARFEPTDNPGSAEQVGTSYHFSGYGLRPGFSPTEASIVGAVLVEDGFVTSFTSEYQWVTL